VVAGHPATQKLKKDRTVEVMVVFEVPSEVDPARLDFSPGFAGLGNKVKYVFE